LLVENMQQIDMMIERDMRELEGSKVGVTDEQMKKLRQYTYM
jgi:hypothetical protein